MVVQSRAMAGLAFQCKIIMCSAVAHRAMASKGCRAETGTLALTLSLSPQTVCGIACSLLGWVPVEERRKLLLQNSDVFPRSSDNNFDHVAPLIVTSKSCSWVNPGFCVGTLFFTTVF